MNTLKSKGGVKGTKDVKDIVVYGTYDCPFTVKMIDALDKSSRGYVFVDTSTNSGQKQFRKLGGQGVPHMISKSTKKQAIGYMPVKELIKKLA